VGLLIDTNVWIIAERKGTANLERWLQYTQSYISVVTVSELLVGVERATTPQRRLQRLGFCEDVINQVTVLSFDMGVAKVHAKLMSAVSKNFTAGKFDSMIAATALCHGHTVLTHNVADFQIFPGLVVEAWTPS
jgi:tRNA(fMet)-specific endonuclease VapC